MYMYTFYCACNLCVLMFRILRQKQYEKEREREFVLALEREAVRSCTVHVCVQFRSPNF